MGFYRFQKDVISVRECIIDMDIVNGVTYMHQSVITCDGLRIFMTLRYPLNNRDVI